MSSTWGNRVKISIYGESHGPAVGAVLDGIRAGELIDLEKLNALMRRRASVDATISTPRKEADLPEIISGLKEIAEGQYVTTGAPIHLMIRNRNTRSQDYGSMAKLCRPGHADYTGSVKYGDCNETAGGGHFSGRLTAAITAAGGICMQILENKGIRVFSHILSIGGVQDRSFDLADVGDREADQLNGKQFVVLDESKEAEMREVIRQAMAEQDSVGGIVECAAIHLPVGLGDPMFDGMENRIASLVFGIPAMKGIEFGNGFACAKLRGSQNNDPFYMEGAAAGANDAAPGANDAVAGANDAADMTASDDRPAAHRTVRTSTNHHGGILGGITSGMPLVFRVAVKPTPTIGLSQQTVNTERGEDAMIEGKGRHDPCIVIRAAACVEAAASIAILDALLEHAEEPSGQPRA